MGPNSRTSAGIEYPAGIGPTPLEPAIVISTGKLAQPLSNIRYCGSYRLRNIENDVCREARFHLPVATKPEAKQLGQRV